MTTRQILELDCTIEENQNIIQKVLKQIKPLSKCSDEYIPFEKIEKAIMVMSKKYNMRIAEFVPDIMANRKHTVWRAKIVLESDLSSTYIYGLDIYEIFAKSAVYMYSQVKKGIKER